MLQTDKNTMPKIKSLHPWKTKQNAYTHTHNTKQNQEITQKKTHKGSRKFHDIMIFLSYVTKHICALKHMYLKAQLQLHLCRIYSDISKKFLFSLAYSELQLPFRLTVQATMYIFTLCAINIYPNI